MPETTLSETNAPITFSTEATDQSRAYIGQWNQLISTTNWEKGQIIVQWRTSLETNGALANEFSDDAWSQLVGGVTPQHVGRLRRTYERFGHVYSEYAGIFWSHFYAALDWDDAEMWLEGAVQSKWSVSKMRQQRWETLGKLPGQEPQIHDIIETELAEETQSLELSERKRQNDRDYIEGPVYEGPDFGDDDQRRDDRPTSALLDTDGSSLANESALTNVRPFEAFGELPEDVEEATNAFKVAIIRHKADQWEAITQADMLGVLEALKQLATTPS